MKKILLAVGVCASVAALSACGKGSSSATTAQEDSLSVAIGEYNGANLNQQFASLPPEMKDKFNKDQMLKGIREVILTDTTQQSYMTGIQIGMQLWGQLYQMEMMGVHIDRKKLMDAYANVFKADSVTDMQQISETHNRLMAAAREQMEAEQERKQKEEAEAKANSPEAKKNTADGKAYIEKMKKEDPSIVVLPSGLAYKVVKEGTGENAGQNSRVQVKYSGKLIDGTEFDSNDDATFPVRGVIPGFGEGLMKMNKGAHYILYIPGDLAYGVDGTPDGKIGPNATLVFDVEVLGITNPETK